MARTGWLGLPFLGLTPRKETVACVLSGGGSRASFQLGALAWLYAHDPRFTPTAFVGTSAGAILAATLSQGTGAEEQASFNQSLTDIWFAMDSSDDMFTPRPWLSRARAEMPNWLEMVDPPTPAAPTPSKSFGARFPFLRRPESAGSPNPAGTPQPSSPPTPPDPLELALTPDEDIRAEWSLGDVAQIVGHIGRLPRMGSDLASIRLGMERTRSMYRPGPMLAKLLDTEVFSAERAGTAGNALRISMVSLESGELRYMREDGCIVDRDDQLFDPTAHHLATGVLASCSIPAVFRPVRIGDETYVDGGTRENLPAEFAIGHMRAGRTYVISSQAMGVRPQPSMAGADLLSVVMRSTEILIDEAGRDELAYAHSAGAVVIHPEVDVHDAMVVHPGLIRINHAYGWMRAAEEVLELGPVQEELTRRITSLRMQALALEEQIMDGADNARTGARLASVKSDLRAALDGCDDRVLPPLAELWWQDFERHVEEPTLDRSWLTP